MNIPLLDLKAQHNAIKGDVAAAIEQVIENQSFIMGPPVKQVEQSVAELCGAGFGIGCASGTDALLLSLKALNLQPGDEVITTPFTFFATAGAISNAGGTPVFVDIAEDTFNIDVEAVRAAVTDRTRAIVPVHLFGQMAPMAEVMALAEEHGIAVIEDAAQAIGATQEINGESRRAGSLGLTGCFSFFPSKNLGGWGDGGMIVTSDGELAERLRRLRTHGGAKQYHHDEVGINSRLDTLQAAVLTAKLPHLASWSEARARNAAAYDDLLRDIDNVKCPTLATGNTHVYHQYTIRARNRDGLMAYLKEIGVGCAVYYPKALHVQPCFSQLGYGEGAFPRSEQATLEVLSLPVYPELTDEQRKVVVARIREFYS